MMRPERNVLLSLLFCLSAPAWGGILYTISPVTTSPQAGDTDDVFEVLATNNGSTDVNVAAFAFEVTTNSSSITLESADTATTVKPYIFAGDSLFGPVINTSSGAVLEASDAPADGNGTDLATDETLSLGEVLYDVAPGASGSFTISFSGGAGADGANNASDQAGDQITPLDISATQELTIGAPVGTPEPSSWLLLVAGGALFFWLRRGRRADPRQIAGAALAVAGVFCAGSAQAQDRAASVTRRPSGVHVRRVHRNDLTGPSAGPGAPTCSNPKLTYFTGPVVSSISVVPVNWNSHVNATIQTNIAQFYQDFTNSSYMDALGEYSTAGLPSGNQEIVRGGSAATPITLAPSRCAGTTTCTVTDAQIQAELLAQISSNVLPAPTLDSTGQPTTYYAINFPPNVTVSGPSGDSCVDGGFCAYHNTGTYGTSTPLLYGVLMDTFTGACSEGCGGASSGYDNFTSVAGHELIETVTDADIGLVPETATSAVYPAAWYDNNNGCGEVADICDNNTTNNLTVNGHTYNVQGFWSNRENACVVTEPARTAPAITWNTPAAISSGTALGGTQLNASAPVNGSFVYNPPSGTVLSAGMHTLNVTFTPDDPSDYTISTDSVTINVQAPLSVSYYGVVFGTQTVFPSTFSGTLPWEITGITVIFSAPVASATTSSLSGAGITVTGISGVGTSTVTWTISPIALGKYTLTLAATGPNAIKDSSGNATTGTLSQTLKVLWGDVNGDGVVNTSDLVLVNNARSQPYNSFDDVDGNGVINTTDVSIVRSRMGTSLP